VSAAPRRPVPAARAQPARGVERALARKREKYEDEVQRLTEAALDVMRARDTVDPKVSDILERASLSTAALYRHFPTKDDLLLALIEGAGANTRSFLAHRMGEVDDPTARIAAWITGMFGLVRDDELVAANRPFLLSHPRLLERFPAEINAMVDRLIEPLAGAIVAARNDRAVSRAADPDGRHAALLVHHLVFGLLMDLAAQRSTSPPALIDDVVDHCLRATLGPPIDP